jgi:hypothetical protein
MQGTDRKEQRDIAASNADWTGIKSLLEIRCAMMISDDNILEQNVL